MNTKKIVTTVLVFVIFSFLSNLVFAEKQKPNKDNENPKNSKDTKTVKDLTAGCLPPSSFKYLDINNVRTRINTAGDMWWDLENGKYEIPKGSGKTAMFSASLWMGGLDINNQLKLAAQMYRYGPDLRGRSDMDFWTGPLTTDGTAAIDIETCKQYDKLFLMTREMVDEFIAAYEEGGNAWEEYKKNMPDEIKNWPAHGDIDKGQSYYLAPFYDRDNDGTYNPMQGDYPYYDLSGELCKTKTPTMEEQAGTIIQGSSVLSDQVIKGDQTLWWVFNDKGNFHSNTLGTPIGVEVRGQAFAFSTNDAINNMTFYSYEIINRSTFELTQTYFSQWADTELGYAFDDYVGCDVLRGLGFCYNGNEIDGNGQPWAYGENPPAVGIDFFQGPYLDPDGKDNPAFKGDCSIFNFSLPEGSGDDGSAINGINFGDGIVDNERFGMRRFVYHNNGGSDYMSDPRYAIQYYNYLRGIWKDNSKMVYGGNGHVTAGGYGPECAFMFPGTTDPCNWGTKGAVPNGEVNWREEIANNPVGDRRFMQSAGPFTLKQGAVNYITVGVPWARAQRGGPLASVEKLKVADDKCQALFDNCFQVVNGPNAPDLTIKEMDQKLIFYITNRPQNNSGNNYKELYCEIDPSIVSPDTLVGDDRYDSTYVFEGYKVYQLISPDVSPANFDDPDQAKLIFQCDIKNGVKDLVNYIYDGDLGLEIPKLMVSGKDEGIKHTFTVTEDAFNNEKLKNHKQYYFKAVAYGYNNYMQYSADPEAQTPDANFYGQKLPYIEGRKNIKAYTGIPHKNVGDLQMQSEYGSGVEITRLQGVGNSGNYLKLKDETYDKLLAKKPYEPTMTPEDEDYPMLSELKYQKGYGPLNIKVIDPLKVKAGEYIIVLDSLYRHQFKKVAGLPNFEAGGDTVSIQIASWYLKDTTGDTPVIYQSDTTIIKNNEQLFIDLGLSVEVAQVFHPGPHMLGKIEVGQDQISGQAKYENLAKIMANNNGFIGANIIYTDSTNQWLSGVPDQDITPTGYEDWIRSGLTKMSDVPDGEVDISDVDLQRSGQGYAADPDQVFEKILGGTWAPYKMTATDKQSPTGVSHQAKTQANNSRSMAKWESLSSVDLIVTPDSTKWTRAVVLEMCNDPKLSENGAEQFAARKAKSVNIHGEADVESSDPLLNSNYISETGMGWFPGYAINVETGERLNIAFGENSWLEADNGRDMLWNPSSRIYDESMYPVMGGRHYLYLFTSDSVHFSSGALSKSIYMPPYDAGKTLRMFADSATFGIPPVGIVTPRIMAMSTCMWATIPLSVEGKDWLSDEIKVELRVNKSFKNRKTSFNDYSIISDIPVDASNGTPLYIINTEGVAPIPKTKEQIDNDLEMISVVPNPYYGYSEYEQDQLDNRVKFINLPEICTITIYNVSGTLVRQYKKDDKGTQLDWDLKNFTGIPISGGIYYIHVEAPGKGEHVIKWFGALRPIDLNSF